MVDRPILFSGPMVRALLEGRKTQTRRVLKPQPPTGSDLVGIYAPGLTAVFEVLTQRGPDHTVRLPYMPGDRLWVRETWRPLEGYSNWDCRVLYQADAAERHFADGDAEFSDWNWPKAADKGFVPSIHMPRWVSRLTLVVTDVRVQHLQEIDEADAVAEGIGAVPEAFHDDGPCPVSDPDCLGGDGDCHDACQPVDVRTAFSRLWDGLNADRGFGWDVNPWVVAVSFAVERRNIDHG